MARAIRLGAYYKGQALYAFDQMRVDPALGDADYLLGVVRRLDAPVVSRRDPHVKASRSRFPTAKALDSPLKPLEDEGYSSARWTRRRRVGGARPPLRGWSTHRPSPRRPQKPHKQSWTEALRGPVVSATPPAQGTAATSAAIEARANEHNSLGPPTVRVGGTHGSPKSSTCLVPGGCPDLSTAAEYRPPRGNRKLTSLASAPEVEQCPLALLRRRPRSIAGPAS